MAKCVVCDRLPLPPETVKLAREAALRYIDGPLMLADPPGRTHTQAHAVVLSFWADGQGWTIYVPVLHPTLALFLECGKGR